MPPSIMLRVDPSLHQRHHVQQHVTDAEATFDDVGLSSLCTDDDDSSSAAVQLPLEVSPLTSIDDVPEASDSACFLFRTRMRRNIIRITFAGALSTLGAVIGGFFPTLDGILIGGVIAGLGNGVSTWLDWEKPRGHVIRARLVHDFDRAVEAVEALTMQVMLVAAALASQQPREQLAQSSYQSSDSSFGGADSDLIVPAFVDVPIDPGMRCGVSRRYRVNFLHCFIAGSLSAVGGWLGGFEPVAWGIIAGAVLSGVGNSVSTALFLEEPNDQRVNQRALEDVPELIYKINAAGETWGRMRAKLPATAVAAVLAAERGPAPAA